MASLYRSDLFIKAALVTGGGTGIGYAIAKELASAGCHVVIASRNMEALQAAAALMQREIANSKYPGKVHAVPCKLKQPDSITQCIEAAISLLGSACL
jgi:NAD(P)-dependent dehydrogenase (short-subunit alcohol dehydrogenase family)